MIRFGASFSAPYAQYLGVNHKACLEAAITDLRVRRLRLMSYWNRLEPRRGSYDFSELDWQIKMAEKHGAEVTLCLGLRQPRWPENHWPDWALGLPEGEWQQALLDFIAKTVNRYKKSACVVSYQLENEARLRRFGLNGNFDRRRLKREYKLVKSLDEKRPVIMSCSDSWGLPLLGPRPDRYGFSIYRYFYDKDAYRQASRPALFYRIRARLIGLLKNRGVFIHELQAEPWGPKPIPQMPLKEQFKSMEINKVKQAVVFAQSTGLYPVDLWGMEWWYWLKTKHDKPEIWNYMRSVYKKD